MLDIKSVREKRKVMNDASFEVRRRFAFSRIMAKDEDVCLHCGLCAERCPTAAWDMQKFWYNVTKAGEVKYGNLVQIESQNRER